MIDDLSWLLPYYLLSILFVIGLGLLNEVIMGEG